MTRKGLAVLDLFCGCGGASLGFRLAGCEVVGASDVDGEAGDRSPTLVGLRPEAWGC